MVMGFIRDHEEESPFPQIPDIDYQVEMAKKRMLSPPT
jgi:hypothetical protein